MWKMSNYIYENVNSCTFSTKALYPKKKYTFIFI